MKTSAAMIMVAVLLGLLGLSACAPAEEPPPPVSPVDPACPPYKDLDAWARAHPPGSIPDGLAVERILRCTWAGEDYRQLETDQVQPILDALRLPSRPDYGPCPAVGESPGILIAVADTTAVRAFVPKEGCGDHPEVGRAIKAAPWKESAKQPGE